MAGKKQDPYHQAQKLLAARDHSEWELQRKLQKKNFPEYTIQEVITWCRDKKYLDDKRFATNFAEELAKHKKIGPRLVESKLRDRRISELNIDHALAVTYSGDREAEIIREVIAKWVKINPIKKPDALVRHLAAKGFSESLIYGFVTS